MYQSDLTFLFDTLLACLYKAWRSEGAIADRDTRSRARLSGLRFPAYRRLHPLSNPRSIDETASESSYARRLSRARIKHTPLTFSLTISAAGTGASRAAARLGYFN